ncbi:MAG: FecR domain-containing protein, partial [Opitutaceae bacterium]
MNHVHHNHDSDVEAQAALWAARIDGSSLGEADRTALETWLSEDPSHRELLSQYCQFSADLEHLIPDLVATGAVAMPATEKTSSRAWSIKWLAGTSMACAALVAFGFWLARPVERAESIATAVGQRQSLTLADGTRVELNAQTSLVIENTRAERHVRLAQGQAYFEVSKDKSRPFIVETPSGSVRVTGTIFDVRTESASQLDVTVVEGSVQVRPAVVNETTQST